MRPTHDQMDGEGGRSHKHNNCNRKIVLLFQETKSCLKYGNDKNCESAIQKLKSILKQVCSELNSSTMSSHANFIGALCIFVYILSQSSSFKKSVSLLKPQFYSNLQEALLVVTIQPQCQEMESKTQQYTLIKLILELADENTRMRKKIFNSCIIKLIGSLDPPEGRINLRQWIKLNISAQLFSNMQQKQLLSKNLIKAFGVRSLSCDLALKIIDIAFSNTLNIASLQKQKIRMIFSYIQKKVLIEDNEFEDPLVKLSLFYEANSKLFPPMNLTFDDLEAIIDIFANSSEAKKRSIWIMTNHITFHSEKDQNKLIQFLENYHGRQSRLIFKIIGSSVQSFSSGSFFSLLFSGIFPTMQRILQKDNNAHKEIFKFLLLLAHQAKQVNSQMAFIISDFTARNFQASRIEIQKQKEAAEPLYLT